tara:strand:- start:2572 stop:3429 length:858 start_codon:yes stop_codon:yes gene_type:complete
MPKSLSISSAKNLSSGGSSTSSSSTSSSSTSSLKNSSSRSKGLRSSSKSSSSSSYSKSLSSGKRSSSKSSECECDDKISVSSSLSSGKKSSRKSSSSKISVSSSLSSGKKSSSKSSSSSKISKALSRGKKGSTTTSAVSKVTNPLNVLKGITNLNSKDLGVTVSEDATVEEASLAFLSVLGCTISSEPVDYSLLEVQTDTETIENESIFDEKSFSKLKTKVSVATDKFSNEDDPFYQFDDALPTSMQKSIASSTTATVTDLSTIAASLFSSNSGANTSSKLKEFM